MKKNVRERRVVARCQRYNIYSGKYCNEWYTKIETEKRNVCGDCYKEIIHQKEN